MSTEVTEETSPQSGLPYGSVRKGTKILKRHPYRVRAMHALKVPGRENNFGTADGLRTSFDGVQTF
jgi:hypothetical protein